MKTKLIKISEIFSKAMVQPIMYLAVTGIFSVIGIILTNNVVLSFVPFLNNPITLGLGTIIYQSMMAIINNLGLIFCIGLASGIAKQEKEQAGIIAIISFLIYLVANSKYLQLTGATLDAANLMGSGQAMVLGFQVMETGVFTGMILGVVVALIHNRLVGKQLKGWLSIYSGTRLVLMATIVFAMSFGVGVSFIWPPIQAVISSATVFIADSGAIGIGVYGFLDRILIPTGLHHLIYPQFMFTELGGTVEIGGQVFQGAANIVLAEMNDPTILQFSKSILFISMAFVKYFGLPGACLAMYKTARPENKKRVKSILLPAVIACILSGISEPIEFAFLFTAPLLYVFHAVTSGFFMFLLYVLDITCSLGGGIINAAIVNLLAGVQKTGWPMLLVLGAVQFVVYYFVFKWAIVKFNYKTLGREDVTTNETKKLVDMSDTTKAIIEGLGGKDNILTVENCFTRLRVEVKDINLINDAKINETENSGIVKKGNNVQVVYGMQVNAIRQAVQKGLGK